MRRRAGAGPCLRQVLLHAPMLGLHPRSTDVAGRAGVPPAAAHARFVCQLNLSGLARDPYETNWQSPPAPLSLSCECVDCELCGHRTATGTAHTADRASGGRARGPRRAAPSLAGRPPSRASLLPPRARAGAHGNRDSPTYSAALACSRGLQSGHRVAKGRRRRKQEKAEAHKTISHVYT